MGKINGCLKCLFIFFNVLFAILGCLLIVGAVRSTAYSPQMSAVGGPGLGWGWVFAIGVLGISCLGIFAGCSEKELVLKIFAGFMAVGMVIMLIFGIVVAVQRNQIKHQIESGSQELVKLFMEDEEKKAALEAIQQSTRCCGVVSASDWGDTIPQSCSCTRGGYGFGSFGGSGCANKPQRASGPDQIHGQSCGEVIVMAVDLVFKVVMGLCFGFSVTALLGLLVSLLMIHQVRRHDGAGGPSIAMKGY